MIQAQLSIIDLPLQPEGSNNKFLPTAYQEKTQQFITTNIIIIIIYTH